MKTGFPIKITNTRRVRISDIIMLVFVFACVLLPADAYNVKKCSIFLMLVVSLVDRFHSGVDAVDKRIVFYGLLMPLYFLIISFLNANASIIEIVKAVYPGFILCICVFTRKRQVLFKKRFLAALKVEVALILFMVLADLLHVISIETSPLFWFHTSGNAMIGKGSNFFTWYMVFFKTSPLLFVLLFDSLKNKHAVWAALSFVAIVFSGTRANVFMCAACLILYAVFLQKGQNRRLVFLLICLIVVVVGAYPISSYIIKVFANKAGSDAVRSGHLQGLFEFWNENKQALLFGKGFCASFYSFGLNEYVCAIELSYWDLVFKVGIVGLIPFLCMLAAPLKKLITKGAYEVWLPYIAFLVITYTNPFLYSSTGYLLLIFVYGCAYEKDSAVREVARCGGMLKNTNV